jgi:hypothetical protein
MDATDQRMGTVRRGTGFALIALALAALAGLVAIADTGAAHASDEHGELTFHDSEDGPPTDDLQCEFWVKGHGMSHENATIRITHDTGGRDIHGMTLTEVNGTQNENGTYDFEAGPFEWHHHSGSESEQWFRAYMEGDHRTEIHEVDYSHCEDFQWWLPGDDPHACRAPSTVEAHVDNGTVVVEWSGEPSEDEHQYTHIVERAPEGTRDFQEIARPDPNASSYRDTTVEEGQGYHYFVTQLNEGPRNYGYPCDHATVFVEEQEDDTPACPENLRAQAHGNEDVTLAWNASADADSYHVYRGTEDGDMQHVAEVNDTSFTDTETEAETTYTYEVTAANEVGEAEDCDRVEVTAIPFFGGPALVAMAALGSVGAVGALRVRRD